MDYFTKSLEDSTIPNQDSLTLADVLVTSFFCCFWVSGELYSDQSRNLKFQLLQEVLRRPRKCTMRTISVQWCHGGRLRDDTRKVILIHKADEEDGFPLFLQHYTVSTGMTVSSAVFEREFRLPCILLVGALPVKSGPRPTK